MSLVKVYVAHDSAQAHFVLTLLERDGIQATVLGDALGMAIGDLPLTESTLPAVWVPEESEAAAREIVSRFDRHEGARDPINGTAWTCPSCGERIEPQFTECWKCGAANPVAEPDPKAGDDSPPANLP